MKRPISTPSQAVWFLLAVFYLLIRFFLSSKLDALSPYASYVLEFVLVLLVLCFGLIQPWKLLGRKKDLFVGVPLALIAGGLVHRLATHSGIVIPFNFTGPETVIFLLLVAPVLEEAVFRYFLWKPFEFLAGRSVALFLTTVLFSYSHLHAIWSYPPEVHPFIYYQATYTLALGLAAGYFVWRWNSVLAAILIHFAFNLGFYLAASFGQAVGG
jgi:membrane protease YdiL (CAAX protease family)